MSRPDTGSHTEVDAGRYEQAHAYRVDDREHDEPGPVPAHECTSPNTEKCLLCVLDKAIAKQHEVPS